MRFVLTTVMAVILLCGTATAQHANFGIKGGLNFYNVKTDNDVKYDNVVGFHLGLLAHFHLANQFALQPEIVFSTQGAKFNTGSGDGDLSLDYINIPLLFQYMFDNGFRLQAGPQVGILMNAKSKVGSVSADVKDNFSGIDLGVAAGVSYVHPETGFGLDARYNFGLNNINDNDTGKLNNRGLQLGVFYLFGHKS